MESELNALKKYLDIKNTYNLFELKFYEASISNITCILVEAGIGKVNASRTTQILIDNLSVDFIFNIGVAGGVDNSLNVLDIVIGSKVVQHDFDITAFNHEKGYIPNTGVFIESDAYLLKKAKNLIADDTYKVGVIASGDIFLTDKNMSKKINSKFNALCVEMEGASIGMVCSLCHVPFLIIRSISDVVGLDNKISYEEFLEKSSEKVALFMIKLIKSLEELC